MGNSKGIPSEELLEIVRKQLNKEDIRILTDTVTVVSCNIISVDIHTRITVLSEEIIEAAKKHTPRKI